MLRPVHYSLIFILTLAFSSAMAQENYYTLIKVNAPSVEEDTAHVKSVLEGKPFLIGDIIESETTFSQPEIGVKLTEGVYFGKYLAVEGTAAWYGDMEARTKDSADNVYFLNIRQYGVSISLLGRYPILSWLHAYGKVGGGYNRVESDVDLLVNGKRVPLEETVGDKTNTARRNRNEATALYGLGLQASLLENLAVSLDWEQLTIDDLDVSTVSLGLGFRF